MAHQDVSIYLFRHGETHWNLENRWQGQTDTELNDRGKNQANELIEKLKNIKIEVILSSDLKRALYTCGPLADAQDCPIIESPGLRETCFGAAEGLTTDEIIEEHGKDLFRKWKSHEPEHVHEKFPGGESRREALDRGLSTLRDFVETHDFATIAVSTHGGMLKMLLLAIEPTLNFPGKMPHCHPFHVVYDKDQKIFKANFTVEREEA